MFISKSKRWYSGSGQHASGRFLVLMADKNSNSREVRGIVRYCKMSQCGHWMMGSVRIAGRTITVSGTYGADGLILDVDREVFEKGIPLPDEIYQLWAHGDGWNGAGDEAWDMAAWGRSIDTIK